MTKPQIFQKKQVKLKIIKEMINIIMLLILYLKSTSDFQLGININKKPIVKNLKK